MVRYLVKKLSKYHAREVLAENFNCPNGAKPDIHFTCKDKVYYIDVGFSNDANAYAKAKQKKYAQSTMKVDLLIFKKDCSIWEESLKFLKLFPEIKLTELYQKLGQLLAHHFSVCKRETTKKFISRQPEESIITERVDNIAETKITLDEDV